MNKNKSIEPTKFEEFFKIFWLDPWFFLGEGRNPFLFYLKKRGFLDIYLGSTKFSLQ